MEQQSSLAYSLFEVRKYGVNEHVKAGGDRELKRKSPHDRASLHIVHIKSTKVFL